MQDVLWPIPGLISCTRVTGRWRLLLHSQNAVRWLALSKRSVEAPQKHVSCMIHESRVLHAMHLSCMFHAAHVSYHACFMHVLCCTCIMYVSMHETCGNTCISRTVYIEIFSVDTFLWISRVILHSRIKNHKRMSC